MSNFRVVPIDASIADAVRTQLKSPQYGHPAYTETAAGYGPCRLCLRQFHVGEEQRILFTYNPFAGLDAYPSPGPIFIHAESCPPFDEKAIFPDELRQLPLTLEAYGKDRWIIARERPASPGIEAAISQLFENPAVEYIHVRNSEAGCYMARVERSTA